MPKTKRKTPSAARNTLNKTRMVLFVALVALLFISISIVKELVRRHEVHTELESLSSEIASLESRNNELSALLTYLRSNTYHEQEARLKLGLQGQGERVLIVPGRGAGESVQGEVANASGETEKLSSASNPGKWWSWLFLRQD